MVEVSNGASNVWRVATDAIPIRDFDGGGEVEFAGKLEDLGSLARFRVDGRRCKSTFKEARTDTFVLTLRWFYVSEQIGTTDAGEMIYRVRCDAKPEGHERVESGVTQAMAEEKAGEALSRVNPGCPSCAWAGTVSVNAP